MRSFPRFSVADGDSVAVYLAQEVLPTSMRCSASTWLSAIELSSISCTRMAAFDFGALAHTVKRYCSPLVSPMPK